MQHSPRYGASTMWGMPAHIREDKGAFYAQLHRCIHVYSSDLSKKHRSEKKIGVRSTGYQECQMWGARGGGPPGGLRVRFLGETRGVHRIRHGHWHRHMGEHQRYGHIRYNKTLGDSQKRITGSDMLSNLSTIIHKQPLLL